MRALRLIQACPAGAVLALAVCAGTVASCLSTRVDAALTLNASSVAGAVHTLVTYAAVHHDLLGFLFNLTVVATCSVWLEQGRGHMPIVRAAVCGTIIPALAFVLVATLSHNPAVTLTGASGLAFTLAVYVSVLRRTRSVTILFCIIALLGLFGPNPGGSVAHMAGALTGLALGQADLYFDNLRHRDNMRRRATILRKIEVSGYRALDDDERRFLSDTDTQ